MNPNRRLKLLVLLVLIIVFTIITGLVLYALRQNISLFYTPTQLVNGEAIEKRMLRVGGMVEQGSVVREHDLWVQFKLTDFKNTITVRYHGILPDLFREGQGIVALGKLIDTHHFEANEVLAKHDANYMPPDVKYALDQQKNTVSKSIDPSSSALSVQQRINS